jgi:hypothetical protein
MLRRSSSAAAKRAASPAAVGMAASLGPTVALCSTTGAHLVGAVRSSSYKPWQLSANTGTGARLSRCPSLTAGVLPSVAGRAVQSMKKLAMTRRQAAPGPVDRTMRT